jgi:Amidase
MNDLCTKGAVELARMIAAGEVKSAEVVDAHLARIMDVNPSVNAVTVTLADEARAAAEAVDRTVAAGKRLGPLAGVPFTVKENIDLAGSATTWGLSAFANQIASADAPMVARLREAGAIPFARTNLPDWAFRWGRREQQRGPHQEPVGCNPHTGRYVRRGSRGARERDDPAWAGQRPRRLAARPGADVWHCDDTPVPWTGCQRCRDSALAGADRIPDDQLPGADGPPRRRFAAGAGNHQRA